jgi:MFS family permease
VAAGCLIWGLMTSFIGLSTSLPQVGNSTIPGAVGIRVAVKQPARGYMYATAQAMVASGVNGLGLALVIPCLQSLTADFHPPESRGKAFGWMFCVSSLGVQLNEPKMYMTHP